MFWSHKFLVLMCMILYCIVLYWCEPVCLRSNRFGLVLVVTRAYVQCVSGNFLRHSEFEQLCYGSVLYITNGIIISFFFFEQGDSIFCFRMIRIKNIECWYFFFNDITTIGFIWWMKKEKFFKAKTSLVWNNRLNTK